MLELNSVCVDYGAVKAVQSVDLRVEEGEVVALLGPNGAGKTSLISAVMGIVPVSSGTVRFEGQDVTLASPEEKVRRGVGISPEGRRVFANLTVAENLQLGASTQPDKAVRAAQLAKYLEMFPILKERYHQKAGTLSGGEQQQLAISRCLMSAPRIVMLDEPSLGLAPVIVERIFELIAELKAAGLTILLVEQNASEALNVADRAYLMHSGRLRFEGSAQDLLNSDDLMSHYMGLGEAQ
ncbi:MAG TPA: ABC transporter ATP-binding protein [Mesorhizobium sp.]|nr:ABC transporter ATP-binding protein [Mesorhizobium sp.]